MQKAGAQHYASQHGLALVVPDTSPRGVSLPGDSDHWDFGIGAGFYLDASQEPWSKYYRMYDYVVNELPKVLSTAQFSTKDQTLVSIPVDVSRASIMGHSMGMHVVCVQIRIPNAI